MKQKSLIIIIGSILIAISLTVIAVHIFQPQHTPNQAATHEAHKQLYHCPMHPTYVADQPGKCPICGMDLVPFTPEDQDPQSSGGIPDHTTVKISPEKQQLIGVKTDKVISRALAKTIRANGRITYAEPGLATINTRFAGWIDKLFVNAIGQLVKPGDPLFSIYSPELVSAQQEYLLALEATKTKTPELFSNAEALLKATKQKLLSWNISEEQINEIAQQGKPSRTLTINSLYQGFITKKEVEAGQYIMAGALLYQIADLNTVWVETQIYEYELPYIKIGAEADIELTAYPNEHRTGSVTYIYPTLNPETRTIKLRIELPNPDYKLKIDMYGIVNLKMDLGTKLAVPVEAVLDSGTRQIVFITQPDGLFEPREVKLGARVNDYYEVLSGISENELVVTSGNFLIDSESRLKASMKDMSH
jgi:membrane fusion protein, copper/silver efflux system